ncbi:hypothetical protein AVEN_183419-1 [Araneus ventricosus]|uniref:Uncharacterized protein n=1 Tax=Araneus ventricosus TaxID=182803 RepID=A0A4Y2TIB3_ARAVE|nr:hypothetical protein AVEN_183419-1 [Araneus ventricosus]
MVISGRGLNDHPGWASPIHVASSQKAPVLKGVEEKSRIGIKELRKWGIRFCCIVLRKMFLGVDLFSGNYNLWQRLRPAFAVYLAHAQWRA